MKIGIIGNGFVGKATNILRNDDVDIIMYDINPDLCSPVGTTLKNVCDCDIVFISVPTPMNKDGSCHLDILDNVIEGISKIVDLNEKLIVIRSTVPPGTSDRLNCFFMPEFLTEKNFEYDFINNKNWIFGLKNNSQDIIFKEKINDLLRFSFIHKKINYNNIHFVTNSEAEMIKLFRNNFLATKISFCNEIQEFCSKKNINYDNVRELAVLDNRIGESHSKVPGHDGLNGYGGTCFPKDTHNLSNEMKKIGMKSYIIDGIIDRNEIIDRPTKDWEANKGRSCI